MQFPLWPLGGPQGGQRQLHVFSGRGRGRGGPSPAEAQEDAQRSPG